MSGDLRFSVSLDDLPEAEEKKPQGWDVVGGRVQTVLGENEIEVARAPEPEIGGVEIEIVREDPRRNRDSGDDVARAQLEERYERLQAEKTQYEAAAIAERQWRQQTDEAIAHARDRDAIAVEYHNEGQRIEDAKNRYANASYYGRHAEMAEIAEEIAQRTQHKKTLEGVHEALDQRSVLPPPPQYQQQQTTSDPFDAWVDAANLLPEDKAYLRQRKEFVQAHPDNGVLIQSAANIAEKRYGLIPGTQEYHDHIDREVGLADADAASQPGQTRKQGGATRRPMAAPASRSSGRSNQSHVHLNEFDLKTCRELNISPQEYARTYKTNAAKGQLTRAEAGGRMHATYTANSFEDHY
jgi:hypothetical protein